MTLEPRPTLFGVFSHVWLREFAQKLPGRPMTLGEIPDAELDRLQGLGINWLWLIGVWQTGPHGRGHAVSHPDLRKECQGNLFCDDLYTSSSKTCATYCSTTTCPPTSTSACTSCQPSTNQLCYPACFPDGFDFGAGNSADCVACCSGACTTATSTICKTGGTMPVVGTCLP